MGEMIGNIAHQWRQPLNNISLLSSVVVHKYKTDTLKDEDIERFSQKSKSTITLMNETIDDFRDFFKSDESHSKIDVCEVLDSSLSMMDDSLKFHSIDVVHEKSFCPEIYGLKNELAQVVLNLLSNAKDALVINKVESPRIKINIQDQSDTFCISIEDNAGGVDEQNLQKLCEPYYTTKKDQGGTGIG